MVESTLSAAVDCETHAIRQVGVAVVGAGAWRPSLLHVLDQNQDVDLRWICDLASARVAKYRLRHPDARLTTRLERVLADPDVEAVVLATPLHTHHELAAHVLEAGRHVFAVKPLSSSTELADDLAARARDRRRILMCGNTSLHSPAVRTIKRMIDAGKLGDVYFISSIRGQAGIDQGMSDVSVIWDLGPHDFAILLHWLSEVPTSVRAVGHLSGFGGVADLAFVTFRFASGIVANVELSRRGPVEVRRTVAAGSERIVVHEDGGREPLRVFDRGVLYRRETASRSVDSFEPLGLELSAFVRAIRTGDTMEPQKTLARSVVRVAEAAERSLALGGVEVPLDADEVPARPARRGLVAV